MSVDGVDGWKCQNCGNLFDDKGDSDNCCGAVVNEKFECDGCGEIFEEEEEAEECCPEEVDPNDL